MKTIIAAIIATTFAMGTAFAQTPATTAATTVTSATSAQAASVTNNTKASVVSSAKSAMPTAVNATAAGKPEVVTSAQPAPAMTTQTETKPAAPVIKKAHKKHAKKPAADATPTVKADAKSDTQSKASLAPAK
ncbi:hypothetical protein ACO0KY_10795 [Undibacterium sp. Dicai25W]|uniref:hypothetical protein n=1 Tax=Undibacterium sp. Dicai25W TaxID=3413034 RepID=UPI003BF42AAA